LNIKKIVSGTTEAGNANGFESTPVYLISLAGKNDLWRLTGTASGMWHY
jgi:hypothetical protein